MEAALCHHATMRRGGERSTPWQDRTVLRQLPRHLIAAGQSCFAAMGKTFQALENISRRDDHPLVQTGGNMIFTLANLDKDNSGSAATTTNHEPGEM